MKVRETKTTTACTLTVENFYVIKRAKLEFGKITVLIGQQSSGKSLLCRLAYFFQHVVIELAAESIKSGEEFDKLERRVINKFTLWFAYDAVASDTSLIRYSAGSYEILFSIERNGVSGGGRTFCEFSRSVEDAYKEVWGKLDLEKRRRESVPNPQYFSEEIRDRLSALRGPDSPDVYSYIPSTRAFFLSIHQAMFGTAGRSDDIQLRFSQDFSYGFEGRIPKPGLEHPLTHWINAEAERILQGKVVSAGSDYHFKSTDGRTLYLPTLSSGTQELLPLMTCLREYVAASAAISTTRDIVKARYRRLFFLEEPESNVFPSTQYDLVRIFARMSNELALDAHWVITTHSPYVLSAFNNLLEASNVAASNPGARRSVTEIIPENYWIKSDEFMAYAVEDGVLRSIVGEDTGLVSTNYLDQVSETIGSEFDALLRLGYVES